MEWDEALVVADNAEFITPCEEPEGADLIEVMEPDEGQQGVHALKGKGNRIQTPSVTRG